MEFYDNQREIVDVPPAKRSRKSKSKNRDNPQPDQRPPWKGAQNEKSQKNRENVEHHRALGTDSRDDERDIENCYYKRICI